VNRWRQPWSRFELDGRVCRLQTLDPGTAFELEPELLERLGDTLALALANPGAVADALTKGLGAKGDPEARAQAGAAAIRRAGGLVTTILRTSTLERVGPSAKWRLLAAQISQTYGPLWSRSPYKAGRRKANDYGVPLPNASRTTQWAAELARQGYAASTMEIMREWTPADMIDVVESAARNAEIQARAGDAAREGSR
jgi:hypothetical protein